MVILACFTLEVIKFEIDNYYKLQFQLPSDKK